MQHWLIDQRLIFGIGQWIGRAVHSLGPVARGAVLTVERGKVHHRIGTRHFWSGLGMARKLSAAEYSHTGNQQEEARRHFGSSSRWCSSIIPGVSNPMRAAKGRYCSVRMWVCWATTQPATRPKVTWETTNHHQSIRSAR